MPPPRSHLSAAFSQARTPWRIPDAAAGPRQWVLRLRAPNGVQALWLSVGTRWGAAGPQAFAAGVYFGPAAPAAEAVAQPPSGAPEAQAFEEAWPLDRAAVDADGTLGVGECALGPTAGHGLLLAGAGALFWRVTYDPLGRANGELELWRPYRRHARRRRIPIADWQADVQHWRGNWTSRLHVDATGQNGVPWSARSCDGRVALYLSGRRYALRGVGGREGGAARGAVVQVRALGVAGRLALQLRAPAACTAQLRQVGDGVLEIGELLGAQAAWRPWFGAGRTLKSDGDGQLANPRGALWAGFARRAH